MRIDNFIIDKDSPTFIIAELSANHNGNFDIAVKTIEAAAKAGADAIKLQTYTADTITLDCDNEYFQIKQGTLWDGMTLYDLYQKAYTPWEWQPKLKKVAEANGLICFSSPFDKTSVDFLEDMDVPVYKIASFEITDTPLIEYVASKGKPVIISTGIAQIEDIQLAVDTCRKAGNEQIALLKCTSSYPAPVEEMNLLTIPDMANRFNVISGLSDHTLGSTVAVASVALGAKIIEKHFILDRSIGGPDAEFSMEAKEFKQMVSYIRDVEAALGTVSYELTNQTKLSKIFSRSLFVVEDVEDGETFTSENVRSIRPGQGMHPKHYQDVLGKVANREIKKGTPLSFDLIK